MRFGIQILSLRPGLVGGQGIFVRRLIEHLVPQLRDDSLVVFLRPELAAEPLFQKITDTPAVDLLVETPDEHYGDDYAAWNLALLERARLDVVYFPLSFFFPRPLPLPVLLHVPDLQHEYFPEYFPPDQLAWRRARIPESVALADGVVTYTQSSAAGLRDKLGCDERKLHVIGAGGFLQREIAAGLCAAPGEAADETMVFYPAADWPHKNHETLFHALAILARRGRDERLVLTGIMSQRRDALHALADELRIADRVDWRGCVAQHELINLYRSARLMAFPSQFEGFGLPLVEAMQLGCPIVASRADAVVETAGGAALHCADDPDAWADAIARLADDESLRSALIRRGRRRAGDFDWADVARRHLHLLRALPRERVPCARDDWQATLS